MTSDRDALMRSVCESPGDDTPRLVFADWLEEHGEPERAEFIRVQCELWRLAPDLSYWFRRPSQAPAEPGLGPLLARERDLFRGEWDGEVVSKRWRWNPAYCPMYRRGFAEQVWMNDRRQLRHLPAIMAATPLRDLRLMREDEPPVRVFFRRLRRSWRVDFDRDDELNVTTRYRHWREMIGVVTPWVRSCLDR